MGYDPRGPRAGASEQGSDGYLGGDQLSSEHRANTWRRTNRHEPVERGHRCRCPPAAKAAHRGLSLQALSLGLDLYTDHQRDVANLRIGGWASSSRNLDAVSVNDVPNTGCEAGRLDPKRLVFCSGCTRFNSATRSCPGNPRHLRGRETREIREELDFAGTVAADVLVSRSPSPHPILSATIGLSGPPPRLPETGH